MTVLSDYVSGTISLTNGSVDFTGTGTGWLLAGFKEGDTIIDITGATEFMGVIASIDTNAGGKLTKPWEGPTLVDAPYRMRYQPDGSRVSAQARNLIELLGDGTLVSLAGLTGPGVIELLAGGGAQVVPKSDLVNGVAYDVQVDTLAERDAYDGQSEGFAVLVSDVGDGRSALYSKASNTVGDWSDPAYITGPRGDAPEVEATVDMLPPGSAATVTPTPITGGVRLDFELPEASGFYNAGVYDIAEAYNQDDVVRHNGSSFIALQAVPAGEAPSGAFPPVDTVYWQVLAAKGQDGAGTGDFTGPNGSVADRLVSFADASGKLGADSGFSIQTSLTDTGADKVLRAGAYGLGGDPIGISDWDTVDINGALYHGFSAANAPISGDLLGSYSRLSPLYGVLVVRATTGSQPREFLRIKNNGVWQPWAEIYHSRNVLGAVSQSGGVPTGALSTGWGSNANGWYKREADGTQEVLILGKALTTSPNTIALPASFIDTNYIVTSTHVSSFSGAVTVVRAYDKLAASFTAIMPAVIDGGGGAVAPASGAVDFNIKGRWF